MLSTDSTAFLDYEKYDYTDRTSGDSRNGLYDRTYQVRFGTLNLGIRNRGLEQVLIFIKDGLNGTHNACLEAFPAMKYQVCWTHLCRNVMKYPRAKDKSTIMNELKLVYNDASPAEAESIFYVFIVKYSKISPLSCSGS